jgi:hypothetical protein
MENKPTAEQIKNILSEKYECHLLLAQKEEFGEVDIYLNAYSLDILSLLKGAFEMYPPLKAAAKEILEKSEILIIPEISDEEIKKQSHKHGYEEHSFLTASTSNQKRLSFSAGAKWYREQLKNK